MVIISRCTNILEVMSVNCDEPAVFFLLTFNAFLKLIVFLVGFFLAIFIIVVFFCVTIPVCIWHGEILSL